MQLQIAQPLVYEKIEACNVGMGFNYVFAGPESKRLAAQLESLETFSFCMICSKL